MYFPASYRSLLARVLVTAVVVMSAIFAQTNSITPPAALPRARAKTTKPKLSQEQEHGLRLLRSAEAESIGLRPAQVREQMQTEFFRHYVQLKNFDKARQLLNQFADQDNYSYEAATELMKALPKEQVAESLGDFFSGVEQVCSTH